MVYRYSSRREKLEYSFLNRRLKGAKQYDRIAGYFSSSILEVAGEALEKMNGPIRVVCNSHLDLEDVKTAQQAKNEIRREWCSSQPELLGAPERFSKLYELLKSGKMQVKVVPDEKFGLIHGKAGVITLQDSTKTSFIGSTNETLAGWKLNYEILWEDSSEDAVNWVQEEFDALWNDPMSIPLPEFVINDINRISQRQVLRSIDDWVKDPDAPPTVIETPIYRQEYGLWEHQKYFVHLAFKEHLKHNARFILADQVGLGKTIQLALSAQLMALYGDKPILILVPKTLIWQWQDELINMLDLPSAVWIGKEWIDENGIRYPGIDEEHIRKCPRRIGIVSQGLITAKSPVVEHLKKLRYECVIVDEAHKARRKKLTPGEESKKPDPNNLMEFLIEISSRTKSMLLATATPVQLNPIEAWDLLNILSQGSDHVMGNKYSRWRRNPAKALALAMGREIIKDFNIETWDWMRNPFPPAEENERTYGVIRKRLRVPPDEFIISPEAYQTLSSPDRQRCERIVKSERFFINHNPFIRHIVRRTRNYLENTIDPETNEPYMKKIEVKLFGERDEEIIDLPPYLRKAYEHAEEFCRLLKTRAPASGFIRTLLLRRVGSTIIAGKNTAKMMLHEWGRLAEEVEQEDETSREEIESTIKDLTKEERHLLESFIKALEASKEKDPKYQKVYHLLVDKQWMKRGCIVFSQYYDSVYWVAENLSKDLPKESIGVYAGGEKSGVMIEGVFSRKSREEIKKMVRSKEIKILLGTDAASEGLNLQTLGSLINLDLPWNPTRLEQRKGRIQRSGQIYEEIWIYNMRYRDSVEDRVHELLSERFEDIRDMFGQIPDVLEDVWVYVALNEIEEAKKKINEVPKKHPFDIRYQEKVEKVDWENCVKVLDSVERKRHLMRGWKSNDK